jgi:hypothetical protein
MSKSNEEKLKEILKKHLLIKWGCYKKFCFKITDILEVKNY